MVYFIECSLAGPIFCIVIFRFFPVFDWWVAVFAAKFCRQIDNFAAWLI